MTFQVKNSLKEAAKKGDKDVCKILAREIVGSQRAVSKLHASKAQINSVIMQMESQASMVRMSKGIQASTDVMKLMNKLTKVSLSLLNFDSLMCIVLLNHFFILLYFYVKSMWLCRVSNYVIIWGKYLLQWVWNGNILWHLRQTAILGVSRDKSRFPQFFVSNCDFCAFPHQITIFYISNILGKPLFRGRLD